MSTLEIGLYPDATPDEQIAYSMGWNTATAIARTEAFAAIRRAADLARMADRQPFDWMDDSDNEQYAMARGIRMAIRAAIGGAS
jgi:hypothetical protein